MRFTGTIDNEGTQKIVADSTITGNVESSGLTEEQNNQLDHIYNQTLVDDSDNSTSLREQVNAVKTRVDQIPTTQPTIPTSDITAIKSKTDKLQFTDTNDVKSTLDSEKVSTDDDSRNNSKADISGITNSLSNITNTLNLRLNATVGSRMAATESDKLDAIKNKTDKLQFTTDDDVKASLDGEEVTTNQASRTASQTDLTGIARTTDITSAHSVTNRKIDSVKTETSTIKTKTDKLQFNDNNDVISTLDGETVTTGDISDSAIQSIRTEIEGEDNKLQAIKERTDKLYFESEQKTNTRDKVQTYTTVEIGDTPVTIDLSTVEEGIEEIITQLTEDTDEDDTITTLKQLKDIKEIATYLKDIQNADFIVTDQYYTIKNRDTKQEIIKFKRNPHTTNANWSGGRIKPEE